MSLIVCVHVEEGIVLASDSRETFNVTVNKDGEIIKNFGIYTNDTAYKTFLCPNNVGISVCGDSSILNKPISGFVESFIIEKITESTNIEEMPELIKEYFKNLNSNLDANFIIAGYIKEDTKYIQKIYRIFIKQGDVIPVSTSSSGAMWNGETSTLSRLLCNVYTKDSKDNYIELPNEGIAWNLYTLQDAVDFARYAIKTTIDTMHFKIMTETVGEPIDILVIKPNSFEWLSKKELH